MALTYRRPGVYLSESLLVNPSDVATAATVACFVGVCEKGPINEPTLVESWSDYVQIFGSFNNVADPQVAGVSALSYLPFSVYSYFQNGGRSVWIIRSAPTGALGTASYIDVSDPAPGVSFRIEARSTGVWGDSLKYDLTTQDTQGSSDVFAIRVLLTNSSGTDEIVETFSNLSVVGALPGTRRVDSVINDPATGSQYIRISNLDSDYEQPAETVSAVSLANGVDPDISDAAALAASAGYASKVDGPLVLNIVGLLPDASEEGTAAATTNFVGTTVASTTFTDRSDIFIINDNAPNRPPGGTSGAYSTTIQTTLGANTGDSFSASYGPWIKIPHPARAGTVIDVPPGGAVAGVMARIDATIGVWRAPAGVIAGISNAVGVATKFTDTEQGDLNSKHINVIRSVTGSGIAVMGARTRKTYGADRYVSARRTLIYVNEVLRLSTQFAVFENNDQRLWSALRQTADRVLRPLWESGGLQGTSAQEAYYIQCDGTNNTAQVIASGEVRMEVGVALEYPAEFVVIKITQLDRGTFTAEVQPTA